MHVRAHLIHLCVQQQIQELEATLYNALQQEKVIKYGDPLDELQKDELRTAVEKLRRQMLRKSREYDCQILQERMELLHQAHQVLKLSLSLFIEHIGGGEGSFCGQS